MKESEYQLARSLFALNEIGDLLNVLGVHSGIPTAELQPLREAVSRWTDDLQEKVSSNMEEDEE